MDTEWCVLSWVVIREEFSGGQSGNRSVECEVRWEYQCSDGRSTPRKHVSALCICMREHILVPLQNFLASWAEGKVYGRLRALDYIGCLGRAGSTDLPTGKTIYVCGIEDIEIHTSFLFHFVLSCQ